MQGGLSDHCCPHCASYAKIRQPQSASVYEIQLSVLILQRRKQILEMSPPSFDIKDVTVTPGAILQEGWKLVPETGRRGCGPLPLTEIETA